MQKKYGEDGGEMEYKDRGFQWLLKGYDIVEVQIAFEKYLRSNSDLPAPADIIAIIDHKPVFSDTLYRAIKAKAKNDPYYWHTDKERKYMKDYEKHRLNEGLGEI